MVTTPTLLPARLKAICFDLDNTLLDHTYAERAGLADVRAQYPSIFRDIQHDDFLEHFHAVNERLWHDLAHQRITSEQLRSQRFLQTILLCTDRYTEETLAEKSIELGSAYMQSYGRHWRLIPHAEEVLSAAESIAPIGLITNGFPDQQRAKIARLGWKDRFRVIAISGEIGVMKPHPEIFDYVEARFAEHDAEESAVHEHSDILYIGDSYRSDIEGAKNVGWKTIWFDFFGQTKHTEQHTPAADHIVLSLKELPLLLATINGTSVND
jgi:HAD superfamily hydrolase (TIGR01549 family)